MTWPCTTKGMDVFLDKATGKEVFIGRSPVDPHD